MGDRQRAARSSANIGCMNRFVIVRTSSCCWEPVTPHTSRAARNSSRPSRQWVLQAARDRKACRTWAAELSQASVAFPACQSIGWTPALSRLPRSAGRVVEPASRHRAVAPGSSRWFSAPARTPRPSLSAPDWLAARRQQSAVWRLPANLAEGRPCSHDRIVMPFCQCATSHPRLPISSVSERPPLGAAGAKQARDIGYDNSEGTAFMPVCG